MTSDPLPSLERPAFFDGQRLAAEDFVAMSVHPRAVRWAHNRTLHGWGIGSGLDVAGARGERSVRVSPGYAIDCRGRDLVLSEPFTLTVPQVAAKTHYLLTVSYLEDGDLPVAESRAGVCLPGGAVRRPERPRIRWQDPLASGDGAFHSGQDLVLAEIDVDGCLLGATPDRTTRRLLEPPATPYVGHGVTRPGLTKWWPEIQSGKLVALHADVETTSAGFRRTPQYFATLLGSRGDAQRYDGTVSVLDANATGFAASVKLQYEAGNEPPLNLAVLAADTLHWHVAWIGVEW